jgi:hypothetical protein
MEKNNRGRLGMVLPEITAETLTIRFHPKRFSERLLAGEKVATVQNLTVKY